MQPEDLSPKEAWDAAEEQIDLWIEDEDRKRRNYWRAIRNY